jgi:hypothetical protein
MLASKKHDFKEINTTALLIDDRIEYTLLSNTRNQRAAL